MNLDLQEINHKYVTRLVIFALFMYQKFRNQPIIYSQLVNNFLRNKISYDLGVKINCGPQVDVEENRNLRIQQILDNENLNYDSLISVWFKTGWKEVNLQIDLSREPEYEAFLYS